MGNNTTKVNNDNLTQREVDYDTLQIRKATPYLNNFKIPINGYKIEQKSRNITNFYRAFCWYYVFNGNNKSDAYKRAKWGKYNPKAKELQLIIPESQINNPKFSNNMAVSAYTLYRFNYIQEIINLIQTEHCKNIKADLAQTFLEQLTIIATYDPSMFINTKGESKFSSFEEIPQKYRCCVEGIETKYFGKDAEQEVTVIKLADRKSARQELYKFIDSPLLNPDKLQVIHTTLDAKGKEIGIPEGNFDPTQYSTDYLKAILDKIDSASQVKGD